jgi:hypothetical protein
MAKVPLLKSILISAGETLPEGIDDTEVTIISPDDLDDATLAELQQLAEGDVTPEDMDAGIADDEGTADEAAAEDGETLEDELAETPEEQTAEDEAGTELHQGPELKAMVAEKATALAEMCAKSERIADAIPDAKKLHKACESAVEDAQKIADGIAEMDDEDVDAIRHAGVDFETALAAAEAAFDAVKATMPDLDAVMADEGDGADEDTGDVGEWAKQVAGG